MKIIIVGSGRTGRSLIEALSEKNYDITIIDKVKSIVDDITDKYNVSGVVGSGASKETLLKAGADTADVLIALTPVDEINILSCVQAKAVGTVKTVARVFQPDFAAERKTLEKEQSIDYIFNPKYDMAEESARSIGLPGTVKPEGLFGGRVQIVTVTVIPDSPLCGKSLFEVRKEVDEPFLMTTVLRDGKLFVPDGQFKIEPGDSIGIAAKNDRIKSILQKIGIVKTSARKVMIVGGGITAEYLIEMLLAERKNITVIESDLERCRTLMEKYPSVKVSYGIGEMSEILEDENIASMDALCSLTDADETNLVTSMYAWSRNVPSILTRIDSPGHLKLLHRINLDITLSSSEISVYKLIRFVHNQEAGDAPNEIEKYSTVAEGKGEVLQFTAGDDFVKKDVQFKDPSFKLRKNVLVASIIRGDELIIPGGLDSIRQGDKVIIVADRKHHVERLNEIFQ
ncbi:MAG: Trk system potassium transporter TrkA [Lachnospiraceae bacterium]|nr:Trk system potassium transporter TrkA [Lachnospiraceae bacterium]